MGKLVVIEGIDGSGKSTQLSLLKKRLDNEGVEYKSVAFPRYGEPSSSLIKMYLDGKLGTCPGDVNAYAASTFFAVDRFVSYKNDAWGRFYDDGGLVLMDRYTTSNAVHQGAKLCANEQKLFFEWLYEFEFQLMGLPKPDYVVFMDISSAAARARILSRKGIADIHEQDAGYLNDCVNCARHAATVLGWTSVEALKSEIEIHEQIFALIKKEVL